MEPVYLAVWIVGGVVQDVTSYPLEEARALDVQRFLTDYATKEPGYADVLLLRVSSVADYSWGVETNGEGGVLLSELW